MRLLPRILFWLRITAARTARQRGGAPARFRRVGVGPSGGGLGPRKRPSRGVGRSTTFDGKVTDTEYNSARR